MNSPVNGERRARARWAWLAALAVGAYLLSASYASGSLPPALPAQAQATLARCRALHDVPTPPTGVRDVSDRYVPGTKPYLIRVSAELE
jgi:hypothetical protein